MSTPEENDAADLRRILQLQDQVSTLEYVLDRRRVDIENLMKMQNDDEQRLPRMREHLQRQWHTYWCMHKGL